MADIGEKYAALRAALAVRIECWEEPDGHEITCAPKYSCDAMRDRMLIHADAKLLYAYDVVTWREAMDEHHRRQGWDAYEPPTEATVDEPLIFQHRMLDQPEFDATDGAHPAWWRGCDYGVARVVEAVRAALDGNDAAPGKKSDASLDQLLRDVRALVT